MPLEHFPTKDRFSFIFWASFLPSTLFQYGSRMTNVASGLVLASIALQLVLLPAVTVICQEILNVLC
jgi:hypothetical protein